MTDSLEALERDWQSLPFEKASDKFILGDIQLASDVLLIGEAPGADEDEQGRPFCLDANTSVLTADLRWIPLSTVETGDQLLGCDEEGKLARRGPGGKYVGPYRKARTWKVTTVTAVFSRKAECLELSTDFGSLIGTRDHIVLASPTTRRKRWLRLDQLQRGAWQGTRRSALSFVFMPWKDPTDYVHGWLSGFFNGEGHISNGNRAHGLSLGFSQNSGPTCEEAKRLLRLAGFKTSFHSEGRHKGVVCERHTIAGGVSEHLRFLGTIRPSRLLSNYLTKMSKWPPRLWVKRAVVRESKRIGIRHVVDIQTTSGTFVANGFIVHNCGQAGVRLDDTLEKVRLDRKYLSLTNAYPRRPDGNREPTKAEIEANRPFVDRLIKLHPNLKAVGLLGGVALKSLTGQEKIESYRGEQFQRDNVWYVPMHHPAAVLYQQSNLKWLVQDLSWLKTLSEGKAVDVSGMTFPLIMTAEGVAVLSDKIMDSPILYVDVETAAPEGVSALAWWDSRVSPILLSLGWWEKKTARAAVVEVNKDTIPTLRALLDVAVKAEDAKP